MRYIRKRTSLLFFVLLILALPVIYKFFPANFELVIAMFSPLFTLSILKIVEEHKAKWSAKYEVFKILYAHRGNFINSDVVNHLNVIDIIFINDLKVRKCWKSLLTEFNSHRSIPVSQSDVQPKIVELLSLMAESLGLDKNIEYSDIATAYYPEALVSFDKYTQYKNNLEVKYYEAGTCFFEKRLSPSNNYKLDNQFDGSII